MNNTEALLHKPFIGKHSIMDILKSTLALLSIMVMMSGLTIYVHHQIEKKSLQMSQKMVEYVTIHDDIDTHKPQKINFVVESTFIFPIHYKDKDSTGYILVDRDTGVRYIYTNTGGERGGSTLTRYWEK